MRTLTKTLQSFLPAETNQKCRLLKKTTLLVLMGSLEKAVWNWMDTYPQEFVDIQSSSSTNGELARVCGELFDTLDAFAENKKGRFSAVWPLQMMLLILSPKVLEEVVNANAITLQLPEHRRKRLFIDNLIKALGMQGCGYRQFNQASALTCVKLCKASTYVSNSDPNNVIFALVQNVLNNLISLLFNPNKPFFRGNSQANHDVELMIDCFVSCFRIVPHNDKIFNVCLSLHSHPIYQYVLIKSLHR